MTRTINTTRGGLKLCDADSYFYRLDYPAHSRMYWKCCIPGCKARAKTEITTHEGLIESLCLVNSHPHPSNPIEPKLCEAKEELKRLALQTNNSSRSVVSNVVETTSKPLKTVLSSNANLARTVRRFRIKDTMAPPNPKTSYGFEIPEKYSHTASGE